MDLERMQLAIAIGIYVGPQAHCFKQKPGLTMLNHMSYQDISPRNKMIPPIYGSQQEWITSNSFLCSHKDLEKDLLQ